MTSPLMRIHILVDLNIDKETGQLQMKLWKPGEHPQEIFRCNPRRTHTDKKRLFLDIEEYINDQIGQCAIDRASGTTKTTPEFGK